jgi:hypothetical protein
MKETDERKIIYNWCIKNNINMSINKEVFFINETVYLKPQFKLNGVYMDIVDDKTPEDVLKAYEAFSKSYSTIMLIPRSMLKMMDKVRKRDLEKQFDFKFNDSW